MPSYVEITTWSLEEIRAEVVAAIPEGWCIEQGKNDGDGYFWICLLRSGVIEWENFQFDERVLLLDAFCWLWLRKQPQPMPGTSVWGRRRGELSQKFVTQRALAIPDPDDLNPVEVQAVYASVRKRSL